MTVAFFVSSIGDTDLAKATITKTNRSEIRKPHFLNTTHYHSSKTYRRFNRK